MTRDAVRTAGIWTAAYVAGVVVVLVLNHWWIHEAWTPSLISALITIAGALGGVVIVRAVQIRKRHQVAQRHPGLAAHPVARH